MNADGIKVVGFELESGDPGILMCPAGEDTEGGLAGAKGSGQCGSGEWIWGFATCGVMYMGVYKKGGKLTVFGRMM